MASELELILAQPVSSLPLVGPGYVKKLARLGICSLQDLLFHYPFRYADLSLTTTIDTLQAGEVVTLQGSIISVQNGYIRGGKTIQRAIFSDGSGIMKISWFNQPYLVQTFEKNPQVSISGKVKLFNGKPTLSSPQYELIRNSSALTLRPSTLHTGRLVPVYPETEGVSSKWLRSRINTLLKNVPELPEWLPDSILEAANLMAYNQAVREVHFPSSYETAQAARRRLGFDELFIYQLLAKQRKQLREQQANYFQLNHTPSVQPFIDALPYQLTSAQQQALSDITADFTKNTPMNRLLEGDVGSGKTIVAAAAMYLMHQAGYRSVLMAPTEILAHQHAETLTKVLTPLSITVKSATRSRKDQLSDADVVVGTQAVLFRSLPNNVGLVVIDEQHRFGVNQRSQLLHTAEPPHLLAMTATPIPRTAALTLYGELDISLLDELPSGRLPVKTWVVPESKRQGAYAWIKQELDRGGQAFVVCPFIKNSDSEELSEIKAAETEYQKLTQEIFPGAPIGLVHGKMKAKEKDQVLADFAAHRFNVLVATPVVEVGIDIPDATIMMIEGAERFGLAQLHQLRGRVGRRRQQSFCLLFPSTNDAKANSRLKHLETIHSGFELAELDLKLRGPGDLYGTAQSGYLDFKIASLEDGALIRESHLYASKLIQADPELTTHPLVKNKLIHSAEAVAAPN